MAVSRGESIAVDSQNVSNIPPKYLKLRDRDGVCLSVSNNQLWGLRVVRREGSYYLLLFLISVL